MTENLAYWPLVVETHHEETTLEAYQQQLLAWERWLAREQPFAMLRVFATPESLHHPEGSAALGKAWMAQHKDLLQRWVVAAATVVLPPQDYARMRNMKMEKALGVPAGIFASVGDATAWLQSAVADQPPLAAALGAYLKDAG